MEVSFLRFVSILFFLSAAIAAPPLPSVVFYNEFGEQSTSISAITLDQEGNVYVAGQFVSTLSGGSFVTKWNAA